MLTSLLAIAILSAQSDSNGVPAALLDKFKTGVNVTRWFCYLAPGDHADHYRTYLTDADFAAFKRLGVGFVRLCISPDAVYRNGSPDAACLTAIDKALDRFAAAHIAVVWDLHDNGQLKLDAPGQDNAGFVSFWKALAEHYRGKREHEIVFELVNEPVFQNNPEVWYDLQEKTVKAVRGVDPKRTVMVSATSWSGIDTLARFKPLEESNLIYSFHCYDPFFFTHQGAEWVGEYPQKLKSVPFPSSPEAVAAILPQNDEKYRGALERYGKQRYDDAYLLGRLKLCTDWAASHHVPVVLGEFGAYPKVSPPESRARWFQGMRKAIHTLHLANAIWGYDDGLGLGRTIDSDGTLHLDPVTLRSFYGDK
ncbi:MAG TPA: cellulase family glycosylhydrolase [Fimbriimonas sp.]|nr:cellulase family glycosylhydrolase [Fimbriimonas sp.]